MIEEYLHDLETRDALQVLLDSLSDAARPEVAALLNALDAKFEEATVDDGGRAVQEYFPGSYTDMESRSWYWRRRPIEIPWPL